MAVTTTILESALATTVKQVTVATTTSGKTIVVTEMQGPPGPPGPAGEGVAPGGTAGQILAKIDAADFNTHWIAPPTGSGGGGSGTVTSVAMTVPTGLSVAGSPITTNGTFALTYASGYQGYTTTEATKLAGIASGATAAVWGGITGTLSAQTDLTAALNAKVAKARDVMTGDLNIAPAATGDFLKLTAAGVRTNQAMVSYYDGDTYRYALGKDAANTFILYDLAGGDFVFTVADSSRVMTFTQPPVAPTVVAGTSNTQLATTAFVTSGLNLKAPIASPTFTGTVTLPATTNLKTVNGNSLIGSGDIAISGGGYLGIPQNSQSAAYTTVLADAGKHIFHPASDANARTFTIPANATVAYPIGTALTFINMANVVTIAITSDTMYLAGPGTTGNRTLAAFGMATAIKTDATTWVISGNGLT